MNGVWIVFTASFLLEIGVFKQHVSASQKTPETFATTKYPSIFGKSAIRRFIEGNGYGYENYTVITDDGYILNLNRIIHPNKTGSDRGYPLLLVNGFFMQSEAWLVQYRLDSNIALVFANHGYDVWLGDQRGSLRSKGHVNLTEDDPKLWDYSHHEIGLHDLPAFIDFTLKKTGYKDLIYSCISLGCGFHTVLASMRPSYNQYIRAAVYLVPIVNNIRTPSFMDFMTFFWMRHAPLTVNIFEKAGYMDWMPFMGNLKKEIFRLCQPFAGIAKVVMNTFVGEAFHVLPESMCASGALSLGGANPKITKHLLQAFDTGEFAEYDYGREENKKIYGTEWAPLYNMSKITSPVALYYSDADIFTNLQGMQKTIKSLGGPTYTCLLPNFHHLDVAAGSTFRYVLPDVIDFIGSLTGYNNHTEKLKSGKCPSMEWIRHLN